MDLRGKELKDTYQGVVTKGTAGLDDGYGNFISKNDSNTKGRFTLFATGMIIIEFEIKLEYYSANSLTKLVDLPYNLNSTDYRIATNLVNRPGGLSTTIRGQTCIIETNPKNSTDSISLAINSDGLFQPGDEQNVDVIITGRWK